MKKKKELKIMKTTKRYNIFHWSLLIGMLLLGATQVKAVDYKSTHSGAVNHQYSASSIWATATAPSIGFRSTSVYSDLWQDVQGQSMLNADGTVNAEVYGISRRSPIRKVTTPNPGVDEDDPGNVPLSDGLWILLFLICAYTIYNKVLRSGKNTKQ